MGSTFHHTRRRGHISQTPLEGRSFTLETVHSYAPALGVVTQLAV